jgi:antitoxin component YwqK of YwqJK toxin-antitoxin module
MYCYQKDGIWKYYYKNGGLLKYVYHNKDETKAIVGFYENGNVKFKRVFSNNTCYVGEQLYFNLSGEMLFRIEFMLNSENTPTIIIKYEYLRGYSRNNQLIEMD